MHKQKKEEAQRAGRAMVPERFFGYYYAIRKLFQGKVSFAALVEGIKRTIISRMEQGYKLFYRGMVLNQPYDQGCERLSQFLSKPWVLHGLFQRRYTLLRRFVGGLNDCAVELESAFTASMMGSLLNQLGYKAISDDPSFSLLSRMRQSPYSFWSTLAQIIDNAPLTDLDKRYSVSGLEHLEQAYQAGRGVIILTYHTTSNRLAIAALPRRLNGEYIPTISGRSAVRLSQFWQKSRGRDIPPTSRAALNASVALQGQQLLKKGRIIQLVGDTEITRGGYPLILAGRRYQLSPGFAELALNTGAPIVPQFTTAQPDGHIHTTFLRPLSIIEGSREQQVRSLLDQYAEFINTSWRIAPESLSTRRISNHFRHPKA